MSLFTYDGRTWPVDGEGFLTAFDLWDEGFAEGMAGRAGIAGEIGPDHWRVIRYVRKVFTETGRCPAVYQTCRENGIALDGMKSLFPAGYLRGVCLLAGITYREGFLPAGLAPARGKSGAPADPEKTFQVDVRGFLVDPSEWNEEYASHKALECELPRGLTEDHWRILRFLRERFEATGEVPTVYETCEKNRIQLWDLERLFPTGYHRGAVKLAGLRVR
ncbi:MAG: TusE/DsrC/DsvC family sulfur relay protein, partial [Planctomycetes bacterium]|jgi:tRNA 2-thiouridine synthesizing protein E|nr:TusE/DsrC/DsvC family sulfur relay protein [Planctomycetota bacterium]